MVLTSESSKIRLRDSVIRSVNGLPAELRAMVILRYREKFSYEDIANRLSVSLDGVSSRLCQAALRLHAKFGMHLGDGPVSLAEPVMLSAECRNVERFLAPYVDGTLPIADRGSVEAHTFGCTACREKTARYKSVKNMLQAAYDPFALATHVRPAPSLAPEIGASSTVVGAIPLTPAEPELVDPTLAAKELARLFQSDAPTLPDPAAEEAKLPPPITPVIPDELADTGNLVPIATSELQPLIPEVIGSTAMFVPVPIDLHSTTIGPLPIELQRLEIPAAPKTAAPAPLSQAAAPTTFTLPVPEAAPHIPLRTRIREWFDDLRRRLAAVPFWFVSCAFHVLLIALALLVTMKIDLPQEEVVVVTTELGSPKTFAPEIPRDDKAISALADAPRTADVLDTKALNDIVVAPDALLNTEIGDHFETNNPELADKHTALGDVDVHVYDPHRELEQPGGGGTNGVAVQESITIGSGGVFHSRGTGGGFGGGKGKGTGTDDGAGHSSFGARTGSGRKNMVEKNGGSPATENAVNKALEWLAYHQAPDGHWGEAKKDPIVFLTSISTLAFLGAGHSERAGQYKDNVTRAVNWLRLANTSAGPIAAGVYDRNGGYSIAVRTLALCEAAAMSNLPATREAAQKLVDYSTEVHQNGSGSEKLGWRYGPKDKGDLSVSGWFVMALKSAKVAGLHVDPNSLEGASHFVDSVQFKAPDPEIDSHYDKAYGPVYGFSYMPMDKPFVPGFARAKLSMGSDCCHVIGNLCRIFMGKNIEELKPSIQYFVAKFGAPEKGKENLYYWYYGTLCTFQAGGDVWKEWNAGMQNVLLPTQRHDGEMAGSWDPAGDYSAMWGRTGQTAISALCLEVYYRYARLSEAK